MPDTRKGSATAVRTRTKLKRMPKWKVILHNDDVTTMDFVVSLLRVLFDKTESQAYEIMMEVHKNGRGVAGVYSKEIAETKVMEGTTFAREQGFPLVLTMEQE